MFSRRPRPVSTIDGEFDLNAYDVVAVLPDEAQVQVLSQEELDALTAQHGDLPLVVNPRPVAPGVLPVPVSPIFTYSGVSE